MAKEETKKIVANNNKQCVVFKFCLYLSPTKSSYSRLPDAVWYSPSHSRLNHIVVGLTHRTTLVLRIASVGCQRLDAMATFFFKCVLEMQR